LLFPKICLKHCLLNAGSDSHYQKSQSPFLLKTPGSIVPEIFYWVDLKSNLYFQRKSVQKSATYHFDNSDNKNSFSSVWQVAESYPTSAIWHWVVKMAVADGFQYQT